MKAPIAIKRFFQKFNPDPADPAKSKAVDMVEYGPIGLSDKSTTVARIKDLQCVVTADPDNIAAQMAADRWAVIGPAYEAWKQGQELPETGTPLVAWHGVSPEQSEFLRARGIRTVEELAGLTDTHLQRLPLPNLRDLIEGARLYLSAGDQTRTAAELQQSRDEIANLKEQITALQQAVSGTQDDTLEPKRRGKAPKALQEAEGAVEAA